MQAFFQSFFIFFSSFSMFFSVVLMVVLVDPGLVVIFYWIVGRSLAVQACKKLMFFGVLVGGLGCDFLGDLLEMLIGGRVLVARQ